MDTLTRTVSNNMEAYLRGTDPGFVMLGVFPTQEEARNFVRRLDGVERSGR